MRLTLLTTTLGILPFLQGCGQDTVSMRRGYSVDRSISKMIKKKGVSEGQASLDVEWLENNKAAAFPLSSTNLPCYAIYSIENDTSRLSIYSMIGIVGIRICIYKDSSWIFHFVSSRNRNSRTFKQHLSDNEYQFSPDAPAKSYKLILKEDIRTDGLIEGYVEYESIDFYQKSETGDKKRNYNAKGYFRATKLL